MKPGEMKGGLSPAEIRLYCMDMALRQAQLTGRGHNVEGVADLIFQWVTTGRRDHRPAPPQQQQQHEPADDAGKVGAEGAEGNDGAEAGKGPASLRQAGSGNKD